MKESEKYFEFELKPQQEKAFAELLDIPAMLCHSYRAYCATQNRCDFNAKITH